MNRNSFNITGKINISSYSYLIGSLTPTCFVQRL